MLQVIISAFGVLVFVSGLLGAWMVKEVLRNEGPHSSTFLWGVAFAGVAWALFSAGLVFNQAAWSGLALGSAVSLYLGGWTLQRIGRRRR